MNGEQLQRQFQEKGLTLKIYSKPFKGDGHKDVSQFAIRKDSKGREFFAAYITTFEGSEVSVGAYSTKSPSQFILRMKEGRHRFLVTIPPFLIKKFRQKHGSNWKEIIKSRYKVADKDVVSLDASDENCPSFNYYRYTNSGDRYYQVGCHRSRLFLIQLVNGLHGSR